AVEGPALGAGTQLATACDLRVATADARFGIPAGKLGLMIDHWSVQRLALRAGAGPARAMLLAAEVLSGEEAHRVGLVQRIGGLDDALAWAGEIAGLAPISIAGHKLSLNRPVSDPDVDAAFARAWSSADLAEGMAAFRERRSPEFRGRGHPRPGDDRRLRRRPAVVAVAVRAAAGARLPVAGVGPQRGRAQRRPPQQRAPRARLHAAVRGRLHGRVRRP